MTASVKILSLATAFAPPAPFFELHKKLEAEKRHDPPPPAARINRFSPWTAKHSSQIITFFSSSAHQKDASANINIVLGMSYFKILRPPLALLAPGLDQI